MNASKAYRTGYADGMENRPPISPKFHNHPILGGMIADYDRGYTEGEAKALRDRVECLAAWAKGEIEPRRKHAKPH